VLGYENGVNVAVEDVKAELWAGWLVRRHGGTAGEARRSAAELAVDEGGRNVALWRGEWRV